MLPTRYASVSVPVPAPSAVNPTAIVLLERIGGDPLVHELIALYRGYVPVRRAEARAACSAADLEGVRRACRALRTGSAQLGLDAVVHWCLECEAQAAAGNTAELHVLLDTLDAASDDALQWLHTRGWRAAA